MRLRHVLFAGAVLLLTMYVQAQDYTPDVAEFNGKDTLMFAGEPEFSITRGGTVEFWVAAGWTDTPDYDPVVLSMVGDSGVDYLVALLRGRDGLGVLVGDDEQVIAFDFADGQLHHVALVSGDGELAVLIDGRIRGAFAIAPPAPGDSLFFIGTSDGVTAPFDGAIASLRFWNVPLSQEEIVAYALKPVFGDSSEHPALDHLVALSDFSNDSVYVVDHVATEGVTP